MIAELNHIQLLLTKTNDFHVTDRLEVGKWGRIVAGPLRDLEGVITQHLGKWRLNINVTILGQSATVEVNSNNVEPIDPPEYALQTTRHPRY
ncbi:MAG: transcription termination/antitermination protein NusG [Planctomycetota bacterium]